MRRTGDLSKRLFPIVLCLAVAAFSSQAFAQGDTWTSKAPMPTARQALMAAEIGGLLYAVGGYNGTRDVPTHEAYNPATNTWSTRAPLPVLDSGNAGRYGGAVEVIDGKLYLVGGWRTSPPLPTNTLLVYDPAANSWSTKAPMPILSGCSAAGVINRKLYVLTACDGYSGWRRFLHVYDPDTNSWAGRMEPPNTHVDPAAGVIDGNFYVVGGHNGTNVTGIVDVYDPATNTWTTRAAMPTARQLLAAGVINGKLYAAGGHNGTTYVGTLEVYDPASNSWASRAPMPTARHSLGAGIVSGRLHAVGGSSTVQLATHEMYQPPAVGSPPIIRSFGAFAENRPGFAAPRLYLYAMLDDPEGQVPLTIQSVVFTGPDGRTFNLPYNYPNLDFRGQYFLDAGSPILTGTYMLAVTDTRGNTVTATDTLGSVPLLSPPNVTFPQTEQILTTTTPNFQWGPVAGAGSMDIDIHPLDIFATYGDTLYTSQLLPGTATQFTLPPGVLTPGRRYFVRVRAYDSTNGLGGANIRALTQVPFSVAGPSVSLFLNQTAFRAGQTLTLGAAFRNDGAALAVNVKLWGGLPSGPVKILDIDDVPIAPTPPDVSTVVNDLLVYTFTGSEPPGNYFVRITFRAFGGTVAEATVAFGFTP